MVMLMMWMVMIGIMRKKDAYDCDIGDDVAVKMILMMLARIMAIMTMMNMMMKINPIMIKTTISPTAKAREGAKPITV